MYVKRNLRHTAMHLSERNLRKLLEVFERDGQAALVRDGADAIT